MNQESMKGLSDVNIVSINILKTPEELKKEVPITFKAQETVFKSREIIKNILDNKDHRIFVVVGPCSIHDVKAAKEYAQKLLSLSKKVEDTFFIVMRAYFEKPRTTLGWKGLINDPYLNDTFKMEEGLVMGRQLLMDLSEMGLPLGSEALDPITPQYLQDLISWSAIGARTTESQTHREMSSGLSGPIGFKNGTDGGVAVAINALKSASSSHRFLGINSHGQVSLIHTKGNPYGHVVLRGGAGRPNYDSVSVAICEGELKKSKVNANIMIDCSHANSNKDFRLQPLVLKNVVSQIVEGNQSIKGIMLESNLFEGAQELKDPGSLKYGVSITDACISFEATEKHLLEMRTLLQKVLPLRAIT